MPKLAKRTCQGPNCTVKFTPKRADQRFHAPKCRTAAARAAGADPETGEVLKPILPKGATANLVGGAGPVSEVRTRTAEAASAPTYDRAANLKKFVKMGLATVDWISTGIPEFDLLTQIPRGRITQIQGPYGVGKTTLCLNMIKGLSDKKVLYIDSEASLNPELLVDLELNADNFDLYNDSAYFEDIADVIEKGVRSGKYDMIIFDSLASTTSKREAEGDITASDIGYKAKLMHKLIHRTQMDFKNTNTAFVVINQEREVIGSYVPQKYTPGGNAVPYAASLIVALKTIKSWRFPDKPVDGIYKGQQVEATIIKSKVNQPWRVRKFKLFYPQPVLQSETPPEEEKPKEF